MAYQALADLTRMTGAVDSSFMFSRNAISIYLEMNDTIGLSAAYRALSFAFDARNQTDSAHYYLKRSIALESALNQAGKAKSFQSTSFNEQIKLQDLEAEQLRTQSTTRTWTMISGIGVLILISGILYRNNRRQKKTRHILRRLTKNSNPHNPNSSNQKKWLPSANSLQALHMKFKTL
ncbi:MAG: hypothetical protein WKF59_19560 [Chitinophagaceae bacterium]